MDATLRALNRFGMGARIGERETVGDPRSWLLQQLETRRDPPDGVELPTVAQAGETLRAAQQAQASGDQERIRTARGELQRIRQVESSLALTRRVVGEAPFVERLVAFWSNHLCVSLAGRQPLILLAGLYEREVIRPHALGSFTDMVLASARHPAMLFYLDNFLSVGPESPRARIASARTRARGLNENYARELLELHTLGVDGGYSQQDVEALAAILTGWTLSGVGVRATVDLGFTFEAALHQPGTKTLLGVTYRDAGVREGEEAIRDLCAHPSTARFVASKLVGHFVSDTPPPGAVDRVADAFRTSGGNLREVAACLVELDEAWEPAAHKIRTPQDWIVAVLRAAGARTVPPQLLQMLEPLRQPLWAPPSPKGYGDLIGEWSDPDHLMNRIELARGLAQRIGRVRFDPVRLLDVVDVPADDPLRGLLGDSSIPSDERAALAFAGPAFHWR